jgi:cytochrome c biogenesis factor
LTLTPVKKDQSFGLIELSLQWVTIILLVAGSFTVKSWLWRMFHEGCWVLNPVNFTDYIKAVLFLHIKISHIQKEKLKKKKNKGNLQN